ncbi:hypothetical protein V6N12_073094 [Hibiscus sabdariffa]|uniref:Uncharacterized protein n=1 Tax=Hibiscus sabdariffa TaxID=183260 RepID=A0ABR2A0G8_9ROSI
MASTQHGLNRGMVVPLKEGVSQFFSRQLDLILSNSSAQEVTTSVGELVPHVLDSIEMREVIVPIDDSNTLN